MALCKQCGIRQAGAMSDVCSKCVGQIAPRVPDTSHSSGSAFSSEGHATATLGTVLIVLSIVSTYVCIMAFGRVPVGLYSTRPAWNTTVVMTYVAAGLNGVLMGFVVNKVGSVLKHLEHLQRRQ